MGVDAINWRAQSMDRRIGQEGEDVTLTVASAFIHVFPATAMITQIGGANAHIYSAGMYFRGRVKVGALM
jgi:hypothetical protein